MPVQNTERNITTQNIEMDIAVLKTINEERMKRIISLERLTHQQAELLRQSNQTREIFLEKVLRLQDLIEILMEYDQGSYHHSFLLNMILNLISDLN